VELTDVEHEMAGLRDADRRPKDLGGVDPRDVNAETTLVLDLVPARAGADLPVPSQPFGLDVHAAPIEVPNRRGARVPRDR
jgi:hypothetical protein